MATTQVSVRELRAKLAEYMKLVVWGATVEVTKHGKVIARITGAEAEAASPPLAPRKAEPARSSPSSPRRSGSGITRGS